MIIKKLLTKTIIFILCLISFKVLSEEIEFSSTDINLKNISGYRANRIGSKSRPA